MAKEVKVPKSGLKLVTFTDVLPTILATEPNRRRATYEKIYSEYKVVDHFEDGRSGDVYFVCEV